MLKLLIVGGGGFLGAVMRYLISGWVQQGTGSVGFPYGTLVVNLLGCFVIGFIYQGVETRGILSVDARLFILIGFLGSLTTFSTFGHETLNFILENRFLPAMINVFSQVVIGLGAVWGGRSAHDLFLLIQK